MDNGILEHYLNLTL